MIGPLDWRISIVDPQGRPSPEFQRRWNDVTKAPDFRQAILPAASAINLPSNVWTDIVSFTLPEGDWDVRGTIVVVYSGSNDTYLQGAITTTSATPPAFPSTARFTLPAAPAGVGGMEVMVGPTRLLLTAPTVVYLSTATAFTLGTCTTCGVIEARRWHD